MAKVLVGKASDIGEGKMAPLTAGGKEIPIANAHSKRRRSVLCYRQHL
jgi:hypothetical protein